MRQHNTTRPRRELRSVMHCSTATQQQLARAAISTCMALALRAVSTIALRQTAFQRSQPRARCAKTSVCAVSHLGASLRRLHVSPHIDKQVISAANPPLACPVIRALRQHAAHASQHVLLAQTLVRNDLSPPLQTKMVKRGSAAASSAKSSSSEGAPAGDDRIARLRKEMVRRTTKRMP